MKTKELKNYDFDLMIPSEILESRKRENRTLKAKETSKLKLRDWCKAVISILTIIAIIVTVYQFFTTKTTITEANGTYTCSGGWLRICSGSNEVYKSVE